MTSPRVIGLLSWYEELPEFLVTAISSAAPLLDHLVAVDGRYAHFAPGAAPASDPEQIAAIVHTCRDNGIGLTLHVPTEPWPTEIAKRSAMFAIAEPLAEIGRSWYWVIDGDEFTTSIDVTKPELLELEQDAATVRFIDTAEQADIRLRCLFRALPGLRVGPTNHYTFATPDRVLWGRGEVPAADLRVVMQHANHMRAAARRAAGQTYYGVRAELGLELGKCESCGEATAARQLPVRWRRTNGRLAGEFGEFCLDCVHSVRRRNRQVLAGYGLDEGITVWLNAQSFTLRDLYWNWSRTLIDAGWTIPPKTAQRYDALLERGAHQRAGGLVERYRPGAPAA